MPYKLENDSDLSEHEWGEGREEEEDVDKEKEIKTARAVFTITCLNFALDEIKPLEFLYLAVER